MAILMKKTVLAFAAFVASSTMAGAADLAEPLAYNWSGIYGGVHAGYLWGDVSLEENGGGAPGGSIDGFVAGPLAGFNMQVDNLVFGIEGDFGWSEADGQGSAQQPADDFAYDLNWNAHVRARAGFAADNLLFFVAGGLALADLDITEEEEVRGTTYTGFTIGGGVDYGFSENLIGRIEYLHDEFGKESYSDGVDTYTADLNDDIVRAAIVYKFGN
jgi:outer membrane immunogenic protein